MRVLPCIYLENSSFWTFWNFFGIHLQTYQKIVRWISFYRIFFDYFYRDLPRFPGLGPGVFIGVFKIFPKIWSLHEYFVKNLQLFHNEFIQAPLHDFVHTFLLEYFQECLQGFFLQNTIRDIFWKCYFMDSFRCLSMDSFLKFSGIFRDLKVLVSDTFNRSSIDFSRDSSCRFL